MGTVHRHELSAHLEDYDDTRMGLDIIENDEDYLTAIDDWFWADDVDEDDLFNDWEYEDPIFYDFDDDIEPIDYGPYHYLN